MRFKCLAGLAVCACLFGCDQAALMKKFTPPEDESIARGYFDQLRQGKLDLVERDLDPSVAGPDTRDKLVEMASLIPPETPVSVKVVGAHLFHGKEYSTTGLTLEYQFPSKWLLFDVTTRKEGGSSTIVGFHVTPQSDSLENLNRFTLTGKSAIHYWLLTLAVCSLTFSVYVLILCIRAKDVKRKWLWMIFVLVGVGGLAINWNTGEITFKILSIYLPCASASHPLYGPWTISVFLPLGAILFLNRQRKPKTAGESIPPPVPGTQ